MTLQDLQRRSIAIIALRLHLHILYGEGLPRVKVRLPLIDVTERWERNRNEEKKSRPQAELLAVSLKLLPMDIKSTISVVK